MARKLYIRVSTGKQTYDRQLYQFNEYCNRMGVNGNDVEIISEKITSHTHFTQRAIYPILEKAKEGDIIYVCQLDRLGRTMVDILKLVDYAVKRGVILLTIDNGYQLENKTAMGKLYLGMVSAMAEAERELRAERCQSGIDSALDDIKKNGYRVTKRGTIQKHWGNTKGCDMSAANDASALSRSQRAIEWANQSKAVRYARRERAKGRTLTDIAISLGELYDDAPEVYGTPTGCKPTKGTVSKWLRESNMLFITQ